MRVTSWSVAAGIALWATGLWAHSPLHMSTPAADAIVADAPVELVLDFKGNIRLTRVSVAFGDETVDLDLTDFKSFASEFTLPLVPMGAGEYLVEWRGLGDDGHPMAGSFSFTVTQE